jgi:DNA-directed RNA polymerase subunit RPC12/RpoP
MKKNDSGFVCKNCGHEVSKLGYTSRNHCNKCLFSLHVDNVPGDRENECGGLMKPISIAPNNKKGYIITFKCQKCGEEKRNKAAEDDQLI